jgi:tRNA (guanine37-N1)-methyltransferase
MKINILSIFPEFFKSNLSCSILKRAQEKGLVDFKIINIRDFATDKQQITDDRPFGGGAGMVMKVGPIDQALESIKERVEQRKKDGEIDENYNHKIILTSAKGKLYDQQSAFSYSKIDELTIICGHYEGVDERVAEHLIDEEIRIGDYVLTGGEPAAIVIADSVSRLIEGVLGNEQSLENESHGSPGQISHPVYTQPREYKGWQVPELLLSGDHQRIAEWRKNTDKQL